VGPGIGAIPYWDDTIVIRELVWI